MTDSRIFVDVDDFWARRYLGGRHIRSSVNSMLGSAQMGAAAEIFFRFWMLLLCMVHVTFAILIAGSHITPQDVQSSVHSHMQE